MGENCSVRCEKEKIVPDKGSLNRERPVIKVFILHKKELFSLSELKRRVREGVYTERHGDRYGGRVPSKKRKTKVTVLKIILSLTGNQLRS